MEIKQIFFLDFLSEKTADHVLEIILCLVNFVYMLAFIFSFYSFYQGKNRFERTFLIKLVFVFKFIFSELFFLPIYNFFLLGLKEHKANLIILIPLSITLCFHLLMGILSTMTDYDFRISKLDKTFPM